MHPQRNAVLNADHLKTEVEYSAEQGATEKAHRFFNHNIFPTSDKILNQNFSEVFYFVIRWCKNGRQGNRNKPTNRK